MTASDQPQFVPLPDKWTSELAEQEYNALKRSVYDLQMRYRDEAQPVLDRMANLHSKYTQPQGFIMMPESYARSLIPQSLLIEEPTCET